LAGNTGGISGGMAGGGMEGSASSKESGKEGGGMAGGGEGGSVEVAVGEPEAATRPEVAAAHGEPVGASSSTQRATSLGRSDSILACSGIRVPASTIRPALQTGAVPVSAPQAGGESASERDTFMAGAMPLLSCSDHTCTWSGAFAADNPRPLPPAAEKEHV
jgi:hypothetical protein